MNNSNEPILKMRFRLPNGEEFEAEGTREFIERERNYFLTLIGQANAPALPAKTTLSDPLSQPQQTSAGHTEQYMWERLLKEDGQILHLRQKTKLEATQIALLLVAGARVLLHQTDYSALELAKSLKACGITGGRLDRILAPELHTGRLIAKGSKRGRTYSLSDEGFAKAFLLAEKLLKTKGE